MPTLLEAPGARPRAVGPRPAPRRGLSTSASLRTGRILSYTFLTLGLAATVLPFVWMLLGSFKSESELAQRPPTWWPRQPTMENFVEWIQDLDYGRFFSNSFLVAMVTVLGNLVFCSMVGYALAKMDFPGKRVLFSLVMIMLMVPGMVTFVPTFILVANMGLINTYPALILPQLVSPLGVFLMRQFIMGVPDALLEAARLDGAGEFRTFAQVVMPLCGPPLATLAILTFLGSWNNFLWPMVAAQTENMYTLPVALSLYSTGQHGLDYGILLAGSVLVVTPILVLFLFLQRYFVQGVALTGIK
jgi:multiple sugar transport system permease protein